MAAGRSHHPRKGAALPRWLSYAIIFVITAFVLHAFLVLVSLAAGFVSSDTLLTMAGPVTFIVEFGLAAVLTWLIVGRGAGRSRRSAKKRSSNGMPLSKGMRGGASRRSSRRSATRSVWNGSRSRSPSGAKRATCAPTLTGL